MQTPVAYRSLRIDIAGLGQPLDRLLLTANFVGKFQFDRLAASEYPPIGDPVELITAQLATIPHDILEPIVGIPHQRRNRVMRFRSGRLKPVRRGLERRRLYG